MDSELSMSGTSHVLDVLLGGSETMPMFHHCHMGSMAVDKNIQVFLDVMRGANKSRLRITGNILFHDNFCMELSRTAIVWPKSMMVPKKIVIEQKWVDETQLDDAFYDEIWKQR